MDDTAQRPPFWRRHLGERLLALTLAVVTWYAIREATSFDTVIEDVPIIILHDEGVAVLDISDESTDVRFSGTRSDLRDLTRAQVQVVVDVRGRSAEGTYTVPIGPRNVRAPRGPRPVATRVSQITFSLDHEVEKTVPIKVDLQGSPPPGYEVDQVLCTPAVATVRGPSTRLRNLEFVRTAPVEMEGRVQSFKVRRAILAPGPGWATRVDPDRVQVDVVLVEQSATRVLRDLPLRVFFRPPAAGRVHVSPATVEVTVQGRGETLAQLTAEALIPFVEIAFLSESGRYELPVRVHTSASVRIVAIVPSTATVDWDMGQESKP